MRLPFRAVITLTHLRHRDRGAGRRRRVAVGRPVWHQRGGDADHRDVQVHSRRADPATAFNRMRETLTKADLVYANLEGLLVKSAGRRSIFPTSPSGPILVPTA
jgi:hypothetical protein